MSIALSPYSDSQFLGISIKLSKVTGHLEPESCSANQSQMGWSLRDFSNITFVSPEGWSKKKGPAAVGGNHTATCEISGDSCILVIKVYFSGVKSMTLQA